MKNKPANIKINLIPKDPFFQTFLGKTLKWALSVGRYIVIFTELVVILSFVARFSLDRQVTDLNDAIHQKEVVIDSYGDLEPKVRLVQTKIDQYRQIEQQTNITEVFPALSDITPTSISLDELVIKPTQISITGTTQSQVSLNLLINNIQLSPQFFNVRLDNIEANNNKKVGFQFRLRADTQEVKAIQATKK